jgi:hypothetical protein
MDPVEEKMLIALVKLQSKSIIRQCPMPTPFKIIYAVGLSTSICTCLNFTIVFSFSCIYFQASSQNIFL